MSEGEGRGARGEKRPGSIARALGDFLNAEGIGGIPRASSAHTRSNYLAFLSICRCHEFSRNPFLASLLLFLHACVYIVFFVPLVYDSDSPYFVVLASKHMSAHQRFCISKRGGNVGDIVLSRKCHLGMEG
jgi:hypothetical protein